MKEIFRDIEGYEGYYQVSNLGRVKSLKRTLIKNNGIRFTIREKYLKMQLGKRGYCLVSLAKDAKRDMAKVHRLVAKAFIKNENDKPMVNHINGIKSDNRCENLEWSTASENIKHARETGLMIPSMRGRNGVRHPKSKTVIKTTINGDYLERYDSLTIAAKLNNCSLSHISTCCRLGRVFQGNYLLKFAS